MYSSLIHKHSCLFHVKHNKNLLLLASYFRSCFEKNICILDLLTIQCVTCATMPGKLILFRVRDNWTSQEISVYK